MLGAARAAHSFAIVRRVHSYCSARMDVSASGRTGRGAFILFEGVDRSGKSTQAAKLVEALNSRGVAAELWRFPDRGTSMGKTIDAYLKGTENTSDAAIHLLFSANRWEKQEAMLRKLGMGITLVVDRYAYSGVAYTSAKRAPGLTMEWCKAPDEGLPAPDVVFYLQLSTQEAGARAGFGGERYEVPEFQQQVQRCFERLRDEAFVVVDASVGIDAVHTQVLEHAEANLQRCLAGAPVQLLWSRKALPDSLLAANNQAAS